MDSSAPEIMMARPRKPDVVRDKTGRSRGEDERPYYAIRLVYRARDMARDGVAVATEAGPGADPADALAGYSLGRLRLRQRFSREDPGGISDAQYHAGETWARLCRRHAAIMGYELKAPRSPAAFGLGGRSVLPDPADDVVFEVRRQWADCYSALMGACRDHGLNVRNVTYAVCIENIPIGTLSENDFGDLRIGLNALYKVLDRPRQKMA